MVIYEVNLTVQPDRVNEYGAWLDEHIREMLTLDGFESAALYARSGSGGDSGNASRRQKGSGEEASGEGSSGETSSGEEASGGHADSATPAAPDRVPEGERHWTVHYHLSDRDALQRYLDEDAERMRAKGGDKFEGEFTAERRVLESRQVFSRHREEKGEE